MMTLNVNGQDYQVEAPPDARLLWVLRENLKLTGTKYACGIGECGSCTVHVDGKAVRSCTVSVEEMAGKKITTIEGLPEDHPVKKAWNKEQVVQCAYCQPGVIMQAAALLAAETKPDADKIISGMDDIVCRCGSHPRIKRGIKTAIAMISKEGQA
ncbi:MAG: (2Fe-2S)-binding protein [Deltaproteobacteria bacterium]|nr:(2Fe-2S)-binding protein [Deltaproteobacteria bacterium]